MSDTPDTIVTDKPVTVHAGCPASWRDPFWAGMRFGAGLLAAFTLWVALLALASRTIEITI